MLDPTSSDIAVELNAPLDHDCECLVADACQDQPMKPVDQTRMHDPERGLIGNCAQAAVATVLGLDLQDVPDFTAGGISGSVESASGFWRTFNDYLESRGLIAERINSNYGSEALHLASGLSPRGTAHMVVRHGFKIVHDPHPSRDGLTDVSHVHLLVPIDIARWANRTI
jgi:hypothetical protein